MSVSLLEKIIHLNEVMENKVARMELEKQLEYWKGFKEGVLSENKVADVKYIDINCEKIEELIFKNKNRNN